MAQPNEIKLGPTGDVAELSAFGRVYRERYEDGLVREDRASDGTLRRDVISRKKNFTISYEIADEATVARAIALFEMDGPLTLSITHLTTTTAYTVLMNPIEYERLLAVMGGMWSGLTIELREV